MEFHGREDLGGDVTEYVLNFLRSRLRRRDLERVERCIVSKFFTPETYREEFMKRIVNAQPDLSTCRPAMRGGDYSIMICGGSYVIDYGWIKLEVELPEQYPVQVLEYNLDSLEYVTLVQVLSLSNDGAVLMRGFKIYVGNRE